MTLIQQAHTAGQTRFDPAIEAKVGLKNFFGIIEKWGVGNEDAQILLGDPGRATFYRWKKLDAKKLGRDTLDRISLVMGIYQGCHALLTQPERANTWIYRPNTALNNLTPLEIMLGGGLDDLYRIRRHLDARCA